MGTAKRERQKDRHRARLAQARSARRKRDRRRRVTSIVGALLLFGLIASLVVGLNQDDGADVATTDTDALPSTTVPGDAPVAPDPVDLLTEPGEEIIGETPCPAADGSSARTTHFEQAPPSCIEPDVPYAAVVRTTHGDFTIALDQQTAPASVNNFVVLSRYHFYDDVSFHRIIPTFVLQAGDALGNPEDVNETGDQPGVGGPGYQFDDAVPESIAAYTTNSLAMANAGPGTNGSQWFVYVGPDDGSGMQGAGPNHPRFGEVVFGFDVLAAMQTTIDPTGVPTEIVRITAVDIVEGEQATELLELAEEVNAATPTTTAVPAPVE